MNFSFIFCQNYFQLEVYKLHACIKSFCPLKSATYYIQMQWLCIFKSSWIQFDGEYLIWYKTAAQYFVFVEAPMFSFLSHFFFCCIKSQKNLGIVVNFIPRRIFFQVDLPSPHPSESVALSESDFSTWRICGIIFWSEKSRYSLRKYFI